MTHTTGFPHRVAGPLLGALLVSCGAGCTPDASLGNYAGTDGDSDDEGTAAQGSGTDTECGQGCAEDFSVAFLAAPNYATREIVRLGADLCEGEQCPPQDDAVQDPALEPCEQALEALASPVGVEEYCRFSAQWLDVELGVAFNGTVERASFERTRPRLDAAGVVEPYAWFPEVVSVVGPGTAFRGDVQRGDDGARDVQTSMLNEACVERLDAQGVPWTLDFVEAQCEATWMDAGVLRPLKMRPQMTFSPMQGQVSNLGGHSCIASDEGPDTCCSSCDHALGPNIARYGVDGSTRRSIVGGDALPCDEDADPLVQCRDLVFDVGRDDAVAYTYDWAGSAGPWPLPRYDKVRETHPDDRPGDAAAGLSCAANDACVAGYSCYGTNAAGVACSAGEDCTDRTCQPSWFGACEEVAGAGRCVDVRFNERGSGACFLREDTQGRLSSCDVDENGVLTEQECCDPQLGGEAVCDPFEQTGVVGIARYDRDDDLTEIAQCACEAEQPAACASVVEGWCAPPIGAGTEPGPDAGEGEYAAPVVTRLGGVRWDEESGRMQVKLANVGNAARAKVETCAQDAMRIDERTSADGWIANERILAELEEDHDLALCSGSTYRLAFADGSSGQHVRSVGGETLQGRSSFILETAQMRVVPNSLFPTDNLRITSCEDFSIRFSSRPDPGPRNRSKIEIREGGPDGPRVAGGLDCSPTATPEEIEVGAVPCLVTSAALDVGELRFRVDESVHGPVLRPGQTYAVVLPGLDSLDQMADPQRYAAAIHDACGMPLILDAADADDGDPGTVPRRFTIDEACE